MTYVQNPILPGFNPDPCIVRAGEYYYIATSTFEWWPGVRLYRSKDLANWDLVGHALTRTSQIDLRGTPDSGGVWAPGLSHADGRFWLVYSDVKAHCGPSKDVRNFLVWSQRPEGPWSEPVYLNRSGFDPSLFHDADGRKWLVNQLWNPTDNGAVFAGIVLQEYSVEKASLVGAIWNIWAGSELGSTEGPHLYRKDGYYYLITAEGGTSWNHAVTVARSRSICGPYEQSPGNPLLTSAANPELLLQKAGHGSLVQSHDSRWYLAHLCARPDRRTRRCILGRETALQAIDWEAGQWPRLASGGSEPAASVRVPAVEIEPYLSSFQDDFTGPELGWHWNTLREPPASEWLSLSERPGYLRLRGRHSLQSQFAQSLVGFRVLHHHCEVAACMDFAPASFQQSAGLALFYNTSNYYYACVTADEHGGRCLLIRGCDDGRAANLAAIPLEYFFSGPLGLRAVLDDGWVQFFIEERGGKLHSVGPRLDATILSDDYPQERGRGLMFTGLFAVLCAQDTSADARPADFDWFSYRALEQEPARWRSNGRLLP